MKRENRYFVVKTKDILKYLDSVDLAVLAQIADKVVQGRKADGRRDLNCVVVEDSWPEYEVVWEMIEKRVDGDSTN